MFRVKSDKSDWLRVLRKLDFLRGRDSWCLPTAAKRARPVGTKMKTSRSSRVSRMELSFVITQGIFSYGVRPYITPLQAATQPIRGNVKATCDVRRTNLVPRFSLPCPRGESIGNNGVFPQRIFILHWIITCFRRCNYRNNLIHLFVGVLSHSYLIPLQH